VFLRIYIISINTLIRHVAELNFENSMIELDNPFEVDVWQLLFNCSRSELKNAIEKVGNNAHNVKAYLDSKKRK
jgi:Protein of unknown function (DUF3606)